MILTSPCSSMSDLAHLLVSVRRLRWEPCASPRLCLPENLWGIGFVHLSAIEQAIHWIRAEKFDFPESTRAQVQ